MYGTDCEEEWWEGEGGATYRAFVGRRQCLPETAAVWTCNLPRIRVLRPRGSRVSIVWKSWCDPRPCRLPFRRASLTRQRAGDGNVRRRADAFIRGAASRVAVVTYGSRRDIVNVVSKQ